MSDLHFRHVDVFSDVPFSGNSLPVFPDATGLTAPQMLRITQELRHFEAVFLEPATSPGAVRARIFDLSEELPFAGHPLIGAAAVLHRAAPTDAAATWWFELPGRTVRVTTRPTPTGHFAELDQGPPQFYGRYHDAEPVARAFGLDVDDIRPDLPLEVVSTGLRYLVVPVRPGALELARIRADISPLLRRVEAEYAVLFDEAGLEQRHWTNDGTLEDVATGSAAGTIGAYRLRHALTRGGDTFVLRQGRFAGRPSSIHVRADGSPDRVLGVAVGGDVIHVGAGVVEVRP